MALLTSAGHAEILRRDRPLDPSLARDATYGNGSFAGIASQSPDVSPLLATCRQGPSPGTPGPIGEHRCHPCTPDPSGPRTPTLRAVDTPQFTATRRHFHLRVVEEREQKLAAAGRKTSILDEIENAKSL